MRVSEAITQYLPWLMSATTIVAIELQGRKWPSAWALSLGGQLAWFVWIWASKQWGFAPMTVMLTFQYTRNHLRWATEQRQAEADVEAWADLPPANHWPPRFPKRYLGP